MQTKLCVILLSSLMSGSFGAAMAEADSKEVQVLTRQVAALIDEVERLKITVETPQAIRPTIRSPVPGIA